MQRDYTTNTGIVHQSWNARGLICHNAVTKALVVADDGTLWAAVRENNVKEYINIYRSVDNGFSWENMYADDFLNTNRRTGIAGLNQNGPIMNLSLSEERNRLILWHNFYDTPTGEYDLEPFIFEITDDGLERKTTTADHAVTGIALDSDQLNTAMSYTSDLVYLAYASASELNIKAYDHTYQTSVNGAGDTGSTFFNVLSIHANTDNTVDVVAIRDDGSTYSLIYMLWNRLTNTFTGTKSISNYDVAFTSDLNIERDGYGNLLVAWSQENVAGTATDTKYATSKDNGVTWAVNTVPFTTDQSYMTDVATGDIVARTVTLGGLQGFLIGYARDYLGDPRCYLRTLLYDPIGQSFTLSSESLIADEDATGYRFFRPTGETLIDLDQLEHVRIAYQDGHATSTVQVDKNVVSFKQHLLREADAFSDDSTITYEEDSPAVDKILVNVNILGTADYLQDFYAQGLTGTTTEKYLLAFDRIGVPVTFLGYAPTADAETSDRTAYGTPLEYTVKVVIDPVNYDFPIATGNESFTTYIERDTRKVHIPPNFLPTRNWVLNEGNHLKRTVWVMRYFGNEYEITQVVPRFLNDQIAYYEANAYVVGPSNDPFSRVILPSET